MRRFFVILIVLVMFMITTTLASAEPEGRSFYPRTDSIKSIEDFINQIEKGKYRVNMPDLLEQLGIAAGKSFETKKELFQFIRSGKVTVQPCNWKKEDSVGIVYLLSKPQAGQKYFIFKRECYPDELVLVYEGRPFVSLACGNPIHDVRGLKAEEPPLFHSIKTMEWEPVPKPKFKSVFKPCEGITVTRIIPTQSDHSSLLGISGYGPGIMTGSSPSTYLTQIQATCK